MSKIVTEKLSQDDISHAETLAMDVNTIMKLVDLIFLCRDDKKDIPS